jgi:hypothetical protein
MNKNTKMKLKTMVRTMYDYQDMRLRVDGRLRLKADGTGQDEKNMDDPIISEVDYEIINKVKEDTSSVEKYLMKEIEKIVKGTEIWKTFFEHVKGCGPLMAAVMLSEFDIEKATTVSKMWQFAGLNPGQVRGKKIIKITKKTNLDNYDVVRKYENKKGEKCALVVTDELIRGEKLTSGFLSPYNQWLRTKLCGVLAGSFLKSKSEYALDFYYPYKERLENEENCIAGTDKKWKDESKGHRDNAAKRYTVKKFLIDLYVAWRECEGLSVRVPYAEEYLGKKHEDQ